MTTPSAITDAELLAVLRAEPVSGLAADVLDAVHAAILVQPQRPLGRWLPRPVARRASARGRVAWVMLVGVMGAALLAALAAGLGQQPRADDRFAPESLAYVLGFSDLYVASPDGNDPRMVASTDLLSLGGGQSTAFAPDRRHLAYMDYVEGQADLIVVSADRGLVGSLRWSVDPDWWAGSGPWFAWSPGGESLAVPADTANPAIWVLTPQGRHLRTIPLPSGLIMGWPWTPSWSPDGRWLAIRGCIAPCDHKLDTPVLLVATDGSGYRPLQTDPTIVGYGARFAWAPDSSFAVAGWSEVEIGTVDGGYTQPLGLLDGMGAEALTWSPDGQRLAALVGWNHDHEPPTGLAMITPAGQPHVLDLQDGLEPIGIVRWSADGTSLLVGSGGPDGYLTLWWLPVDGGAQRLAARDLLVGTGGGVVDVAAADR